MSIAEYGRRPLAERLRLRDLVVRRLRGWFQERGYVEVDTPQRVACPGIDVHLDAIPAGPGRHLATSPELEMKKLLAAGCTRIFQVARAFRADERGERHSPEFTLLEWYAAGEDYRDLMAATEELVAAAADAREERRVAASRSSSWAVGVARSVNVSDRYRTAWRLALVLRNRGSISRNSAGSTAVGLSIDSLRVASMPSL